MITLAVRKPHPENCPDCYGIAMPDSLVGMNHRAALKVALVEATEIYVSIKATSELERMLHEEAA